jgi:hypothetical protein
MADHPRKVGLPVVPAIIGVLLDLLLPAVQAEK